MTEISNYAKYRVTGPGAEAWLSSLLTARMPAPGRITLTAMLNDAGRIVGEFTVARRRRGRRSSSCSGRCRPRSTTRAGSATTCRPTGPSGSRCWGWASSGCRWPGRARGTCSQAVARPGPLDRGVPVHDVPAGRPRDDARPPGPHQLRRRPRLRAVGRPGVPARAVRPDHGGRRAARPPAVRDAGADVAPAREELRDVVPRVPADLHAARGPASRATSSSTTSSSGGRPTRPELAAGGPKRRLVAFVVEPDPDDPADVIGDEPIWHDGAVVGWVTSGGYGHHVKQSIALGYVPTELATPGRPGGVLRDRDHRAAAAGADPARAAVRPRGPPDAPVTERSVPAEAASAVAAGPDRRRRAPDRVRGGRFGGDRDPARRRGPGRGGTLCLAGDCGNCLAAGRRRRVRADVPGRGPARAAGRPSPGRRAAATAGRRRPGSDRAAHRAGDRRPPDHDRRRGHRRRARVASGGRPPRTGRSRGPPPRRGRGRRGRRDLRRSDDRRPDAGPGCSTSTRTRSSSRPAPPEIHPVCPGERAGGARHGARGGAAPRGGRGPRRGRGDRDAAGRGPVHATPRAPGSVRGRRRGPRPRGRDRRRRRGGDDDAVRDRDPRSRSRAARPPGADGRRGAGHRRRSGR